MASLRVFVSHSHKDNDWCDGFVAELKNNNLDIWYDQEGLYVGAQWVKTLEQELQDRDVYVIVLTPNSWASQWVQSELSLALGQHKQIIGVIHKPTQVSGFLTNYQLLDVSRLDSRQAAQLVAASLSGAKPTAIPRTPSLPTSQVAAGTSGIDISGEWVWQRPGLYDASDKNEVRVFLGQVGTKVTGSGTEVYISGDFTGTPHYLTIDGSIDGITVKLKLAEVGDNDRYRELTLTYILHSGIMKGESVLFRRKEGMFTKDKFVAHQFSGAVVKEDVTAKRPGH